MTSLTTFANYSHYLSSLKPLSLSFSSSRLTSPTALSLIHRPLIQSKSLFSIWVFDFSFWVVLVLVRWFSLHIYTYIYILLCVSLTHGCSLVCHVSAVHVACGCLHVGHVRRGPIHVPFHAGLLLV